MYRFSVGDVLTRSFSILGRNFLPFCLLIGIIQLPVIILTAYFSVAALDFAETSHGTYGDDFSGSMDALLRFGSVGGLVLVAALLLQPLSTASVTYGVLQQLRGRPASLGDCVRVGMSRMLAVLGVAVVAGMLMFFGALACIIPGLFFMTAYYVATPAAVVERLGVSQAMSRSWQLTEGLRWQVFGLIFALSVMGAMFEGAVSIPTQSLEPAGATQTIIVSLIGSLVGVGVDALRAVACAVAYHDLRTEREGVTSQDLARVFD